MNYGQLQRLSGMYFWTILAIGVTYSALIVWVFLETFPGAIMLLVYLLDSYGPTSQLWISLGFWLVSGMLIGKILASGIKTLRVVAKTRTFVRALKVISQKGNKVIFDSTSGEIFAAGFWHPKIFISNGLPKIHSANEIKAMVMHEENHVQLRDPLRITLVTMVDRSLPGFPGKAKLVGYFYTLVEVCADKKAEEKLNTRLPLISALYKRMAIGNKALLAGISFFNSQSERINLLIGKKMLNKNIVLGVAYSTVVGVVVFSILATQLNFYNCPHLSLCLSAITSVLELH